MLIFKNGFKHLIKDYLQFSMYILLILVSVLFTSTFGITASNLISSNNKINPNPYNYDYSYRYTSSGYSSNSTPTLSPFFAFNTKTIKPNNGEHAYSNLTFGQSDSILKAIEFNYDENIFYYADSSSIKYRRVTFNFGDTDSLCSSNQEANSYSYCNNEKYLFEYSPEEKYEVVKTKSFGTLFNFNEESIYFQNSLIGQLYHNFIDNDDINIEQKRLVATYIFDYMLQLNNSSIVAGLKEYILVKVNELEPNKTMEEDIKTELNKNINEYINFQYKDETLLEDDISTEGLNGQFGWIINNGTQEKFFAGKEDYFTITKNKYIFGNPENSVTNSFTYKMKNFESTGIFITKTNEENEYNINGNRFTNGTFVQTYYNLLSSLTNFNIKLRNQVVMWNDIGEKFRIISSYVEGPTGDPIWNDDNYYQFKVRDESTTGKNFTRNSFMISSGYAKNKNLTIGKEYEIIPNLKHKFRMDATGGDSLNIYPTIYDEDLLADSTNQALIYLNSRDYQDIFSSEDEPISGVGLSKISENKYQDVSRAYMEYKINPKDKKNYKIEDDLYLFKLFIADNLLNIDKIADILNTPSELNPDLILSATSFEKYDETTVLNLRTNLFSSAISMFLAISIIFSIIFISVILFIVYNIVKKFLNSQRGQIGNLKSLGYSTNRLTLQFTLYIVLPLLLLVPLGWIASVFLQESILGIFNQYFNIPGEKFLDWKFFLAEYFGYVTLIFIIVYITGWMTIRQSPLILLSPSKSEKPNLFLVNIFKKMKFHNFITKMRTVLISVSLRDMFIFFSTFFVASTILLVSILVPTTLQSMSQEYYKNIKYNNDYNYSYIYANVPFSRYSFYENDDKAQAILDNSPLSGLIEYEGQYKSFFEFDLSDQNQYEFLKNNLTRYFEKMLVANLFTFKGNLVSVGLMDQLVELSRQGLDENKIIENEFNLLSCNVLPNLFGQTSILDSDIPSTASSKYSYCVEQISSNIISSNIKQMWDDNEQFYKNFSFSFGTIPVNTNEDQLYTRLSIQDIKDSKNNDLEIYGIDLDSQVNNLDISQKNKLKSENENVINALSNEKLKLLGYNVGDQIEFEYKNNLLGVNNSNNLFTPVNNDWWFYDQNNNNQKDSNELSIYEMDNSKFTYYKKTEDDIVNMWKFNDHLGNGIESIHDYYNLNDVKLKIPKNLVNKELFEAVDKQYFDISRISEDMKYVKTYDEQGDYYIVRPYDIRTYELNNGSYEPVEISIESLLNSTTNNWYNIALENKLFEPMLEPITSKYKIKIVGIEKTYDKNRLIVDQVNANKILGYLNPDTRITFKNQNSVNIWSNAKMSSNQLISDQLERLIFQPKFGNTSATGFGKYMESAIGPTDYVDMQKNVINNLIFATLSLSIVFISISIFTGLMVIYLITDLFVGKYKKFMSYMIVQGYSMKEINSIILWIFLPLALFAMLFSSLIIFLLFKLAIPQVLLAVSISVPLILEWWVIPTILLIGIIIFTTAYSLVLGSIKKVNLARLLG
ncbi:Yip1 family protein [Spiroplasma culicicola]|uniref:ABC3 transporter permease C-terminal domain-containing protein n=1 Tax=Spiroplasma culicicola AES-1 TaxID=1276246 RepID=W6A6G9_9MOLU|nr:Yip1 family protein [Spiroplasma culicicola]AHI52561.1 hypothetical protein SCULI_v1c02200 [Spiroplasma culicicola AES-1]